MGYISQVVYKPFGIYYVNSLTLCPLRHIVMCEVNNMFYLILLVAAFILFVLAAINVPSTRVSLGWAGMACLALAFLLQNFVP